MLALRTTLVACPKHGSPVGSNPSWKHQSEHHIDFTFDRDTLIIMVLDVTKSFSPYLQI